MTTFALILAKVRAADWPIPLDAPVIKITLSWKYFFFPIEDFRRLSFHTFTAYIVESEPPLFLVAII